MQVLISSFQRMFLSWNLKHIQEMAKELKSRVGIYKPQILEDMGNVRHGQFRKDITFRTPEVVCIFLFKF